MALRSVLTGLLVFAVAAFIPARSYAQIETDWAVFCVDPTDSTCADTCDVVTGANQDFVVLYDTGQLTTLSGTVLTDIVVDLTNDALPVTFQGEPFGYLDFRNDADGFATLFWLSLTDTVVGIDSFTSEPYDSNLFTTDISNTNCDACSVVDSSLCNDTTTGSGSVDQFLNLCGAGLADALAAAMIAFPVLGFVSSRRRRR